MASHPILMHKALYDASWNPERLRELQYTYHEMKNPLQKDRAMVEMYVQSTLAKMAAEAVPFFLRRYDYNVALATTSLARFLGGIADGAYAGMDRIAKLNPRTWKMKDNNPDNILDNPEFSEAIFADREFGPKWVDEETGRDYYKELDQEVTPYIAGKKTEALRAVVADKERIQLERKREKQAMEARIQELERDVQRLKRDKELLSKSVQDMLSNPDAVALARDAVNRVKTSMVQMAYAACADHVRERLKLRGEDISVIDNFPRYDLLSKKIIDNTSEKLKEANQQLQAVTGNDYLAEKNLPGLSTPEAREYLVTRFTAVNEEWMVGWEKQAGDFHVPERKGIAEADAEAARIKKARENAASEGDAQEKPSDREPGS